MPSTVTCCSAVPLNTISPFPAPVSSITAPASWVYVPATFIVPVFAPVDIRTVPAVRLKSPPTVKVYEPEDLSEEILVLP